MKVCVYEHPTENEKIIIRFEKYPLWDYCKKFSFFLDLKNIDFNQYVEKFVESVNPEEVINQFGRIFLVFEKIKIFEILNSLNFSQEIVVQKVKGGLTAK
jgi:hypothetical protein